MSLQAFFSGYSLKQRHNLLSDQILALLFSYKTAYVC